MNNFWKATLAVLILLVAITLYDMFSGKPQYAGNVDSQSQESYERQLKSNEEQIAKAHSLQLENERQLQEGARQLEINNSHINRMGILLERWEKQADRYDAILEKWEKQSSAL